MIRTAILALLLAGCGSHQRAPRQGLVRLSDDEEKGHRGDVRVELGLARMECNPAGLACRVSLKPGLRFSDGTPITAQTFAQGFQPVPGGARPRGMAG